MFRDNPLGIARVSIVAWLVFAAPASALQAVVARQVAAPASDIRNGLVRLPDPASTPTGSRAAIVPLEFANSPGGFVAEVDFPVERDGTLTLALCSPAAATWSVFGGPVGERPRLLESRTDAREERFEIRRSLTFAGDALPGWVVDLREIRGVAPGAWRVRIEAPSLAPGILVASADASLGIESWVTTQHLVAGTGAAIVARAQLSAGAPAVSGARVVFETSAAAVAVPMLDDGAHEDGAPNDGLFGAFVPDELPGDVTARVELRGATSTGAAFLRTALVAFPMHGPRLALDGTARAERVPGAEELRLTIGAIPLDAPTRLHVSTEVWGRDANGAAAPVCWLSRMLAPELVGEAWELPLALDLGWLEVSGVGTPLELRAVRVQDPDSEAVLDLADRISLATTFSSDARDPIGTPTPRMLTGNAALILGSAGALLGTAGSNQGLMAQRALMLVHGYCSSGSIWPAANFTQPKLEFLDPNQNRTHDQFAQLIAQRAASQNKFSFGVVAHSQGGPASLHLLTYYQSGLDRASGGRRIQSVAAPYQGTPLASWGGFACGVNNNMTPAGSATWLAGIPSWARAEVYTWTTANSGAACNAITNLLLTDPEDGTVEKTRSELPGGNNMGHTVGWCHTTGMSNPANYTDATRNALMNTAAGR